MSKFGQYQLLERIAVGGMGEVYRARSLGEEGFEKPVAIKRILPSYASDVRFVEMLVTEARIHAPLNHRNIVQIHDLGISEDHEYFIVLEYVDGHDLGGLLSRLNERRLRGIGPVRVPDAVALYIAIELGEGLHFAHELRDENAEPLGLVHRDICPSNVLLSYAGEVKLSDFGLAKRNTDHSVVGSLKGQLAYMSPEQARRAPLDRRSDIFSLGAVLFEMLTGQALRTFGDDIAGWQQVASGTVPSARQHRADILPALEQLLEGALAPDARDRLPDARAFVAEARGALDLLPRSRVGEAGELNALMRGLLPPGRPRPAKAQSKVIRLLSELTSPPRQRDGAPSITASIPAANSLGARTPPPPVEPDREEPTPPVVRAAPEKYEGDYQGDYQGDDIDGAGSRSGAYRDARSGSPGTARDAMWPALLDLVAPPIGSTPAIAGLAAPPIRPPPPSQPVFRPPPPPIPAEARLPPPPPPIPWPPPPRYSERSVPVQPHEPLTPMEEIELLEEPPPPMSMQPGQPMEPMHRQAEEPMDEDTPELLPMDDGAAPGIPDQAGMTAAAGEQPDWTAPEQGAQWRYAEYERNLPERARYPTQRGYSVGPQGLRRPRGRLWVVLAAAAAAALIIVHFAILPLDVMAVWRAPARLEVESFPTGAEIFIDGRRLSARTPAFIEVNRDFEQHLVEIRLEGFRSEQQQISYADAVKLAVSVRLTATGAAEAETTAAPPPRAGRAPK